MGLKCQKLPIYRAWPWISNLDSQGEPELGTFRSPVQRSFQPAVTTPSEKSHCGSVVLVVAELRHCFAIRINMNTKNSRAKPETNS